MSESLTTTAAASWSGVRELQKGRSYIRSLSELTLEPGSPRSGPGGVVIRGEAQGQERYQIQATIQAGKVTRAHCSCYVGSGGHCKHTAALLSRYAASPGDFQMLRPLSDTLGSLNTQQFQTLIGQMLNVAPELRRMIDSFGQAVSGGSTSQAATIPALFDQIEADYGHHDNGYDQWNDWDDEGPDTSALETLLAEADAQHGSEPAAALSVYLQMIRSAETAYETWADSDNEPFDHLLSGAVNGIMSLVTEGRLEEPTRTDAVEAVLALENPYLLTQATLLSDFAAQLESSERTALTHLLQQLHDQSRDRHTQGQVARALLRLVPTEQQTPAQREAVLLGGNDLEQITEFYLNSDDPGARTRLSTYLQGSFQPLEPIFGLIQSHEAGELLEGVVQERLSRQGGPGALGAESHWLFVRLAGSGRLEEAAALAERGLLTTADPHWEALLMSVTGDWAQSWPRLLAALSETPKLRDATLKLLLSGAHELGEAIHFDLRYGTHISPARRNLLAEALTQQPETWPRAAEIRFELAERLVSGRGRSNYQEACSQLNMMAALISQAEVQHRVQRLVRANSHLYAFKEELRRAGLL